MSENHEHHYSGNGHYPGADTHQAGWVMWVTLGASSTFVATVLTISFLTDGTAAHASGSLGFTPTMIVGGAIGMSLLFWALSIFHPKAQPSK